MECVMEWRENDMAMFDGFSRGKKHQAARLRLTYKKGNQTLSTNPFKRWTLSSLTVFVAKQPGQAKQDPVSDVYIQPTPELKIITH